ncbi:hypothetical protein OQJ62_07225 [Microbulbifer thermotolerans]|uniref:hypothetical protein n=1 Tax=Microbulbifer thermotolerans TaxID=252514 RepID=UPI002248F3BE|nr:hypothetical protein [Microbulbifer thermotolerans]MCX2794707.1 hypothetical protein [Microbulbifer thermotolerans]
MYHHLALIALVLTIGLAGCGRNSDTHDPGDHQTTPPDEGATEMMEEPVTPPAPPESAEPPSDDSAAATICTPEWFVWVHEQVITMQNGDMAELYPAGLPEVGTDEWFLAIDKLTGGDGTHGPDGGSEEWCRMIQQRLEQSGQ